MIYLYATIRGFLVWLCVMPLSCSVLVAGLWLGAIRLVYSLAVHRE